MTRRVLIIGSGLTAYACLSGLLDKSNVQVTVVDAGFLQGQKPSQSKILKSTDSVSGKKNGSDSRERIAGKTFMGEAFSYDMGQLGINYSPRVNFRASVGFGGFTKVWGATGFPYSKLSSREFPDGEYDEIISHAALALENLPYRYAKSNLDRLYPVGFGNSLKPEGKLVESMLEVDANGNLPQYLDLFGPSRHFTNDAGLTGGDRACTYCGMCNLGCPTGAIWCTDVFFQDAIRGNLVDYRRGIVNLVAKGKNLSWEVSWNELDNSCSEEFDHVFLTSGAISSAALLMRSKLIQSEAYIDDNQTTMAAFLNIRPRLSDLNKKFFMSELFSVVLNKHATRVDSALQLYSASSELLERVVPLGNQGSIRQRIAKIVSPFFAFGLHYLNADESGQIMVKSKGDGVEIDSRNLPSFVRVANRVWAHRKNLIKVGLVPIPLGVARMGVGDGYHFGNIRPEPQGGSMKINRLGELENMPGLHLIDGLGLGFLEPGSISIMLAGRARLITERVVKGE